ncbi:hypothetical protein ABSL23_09265 [Halobacterium sp. NMX12-1]|uniref:Uncharacterized protein n=1 Tax=Halobacterium sp. NMX12-1 TaxID=3166650 RepID=A0AAU8CB02_9EURY
MREEGERVAVDFPRTAAVGRDTAASADAERTWTRGSCRFDEKSVDYRQLVVRRDAT